MPCARLCGAKGDGAVIGTGEKRTGGRCRFSLGSLPIGMVVITT